MNKMGTTTLDRISWLITGIVLLIVGYWALWSSTKIMWGREFEISPQLFLVFVLAAAIFRVTIAGLTVVLQYLTKLLDTPPKGGDSGTTIN